MIYLDYTIDLLVYVQGHEYVGGNILASVLTPYRSSDGNNPYTEAQLKALWKDLEPTAREPGKYSAPERVLLQRTFLAFIQEGYTATRAVSRLQALALKEPDKWPYADYATFMAWKAYDKDFSDAYEIAYSMGTDTLEDKGVEMAYGGNASMLQFLLRMRSPQRYIPPTVNAPGASGNPIEHVHRIELVAAKARPLEIEDFTKGGNIIEYSNAEVVPVDDSTDTRYGDRDE